jgi:hypothetical protein
VNVTRSRFLLPFALCLACPAGPERDASPKPPPAAATSSPVIGLAALTIQIPLDILPARVGPDVDGFSAALNDLKPVIAAFDREHAGALGDAVDIWLAVKPNGRMKAWIAAPGALSNETRKGLAGRIEAAKAPRVVGLVVVAMRCNRTGQLPASPVASVPQEFAAMSNARAMHVEELVLAAWPD